MANENKCEGFDCIAFKKQAQKKMMKEFEANRGRFKTFVEYINWKSGQPSGNPKFDAKIKQLREIAEEKHAKTA